MGDSIWTRGFQALANLVRVADLIVSRSCNDDALALAARVGLVALQGLAGVERLLDLTAFHVRYHLDEKGHDDGGPTGLPATRDSSRRLARRDCSG